MTGHNAPAIGYYHRLIKDLDYQAITGTWERLRNFTEYMRLTFWLTSFQPNHLKQQVCAPQLFFIDYFLRFCPPEFLQIFD